MSESKRKCNPERRDDGCAAKKQKTATVTKKLVQAAMLGVNQHDREIIADLKKELTAAQNNIIKLINEQSLLTVVQLRHGIEEVMLRKRLAAARDTIHELKSNPIMRMTDTYREIIRYHNLYN